MTTQANVIDEATCQLTERELAVLDFEAAWWTSRLPKDQEIRERFNLSPVRYYQILNGLIDRDDALLYSPLLVKRLRRMREQRQRDRSAARLRDR